MRIVGVRLSTVSVIRGYICSFSNLLSCPTQPQPPQYLHCLLTYLDTRLIVIRRRVILWELLVYLTCISWSVRSRCWIRCWGNGTVWGLHIRPPYTRVTLRRILCGGWWWWLLVERGPNDSRSAACSCCWRVRCYCLVVVRGRRMHGRR